MSERRTTGFSTNWIRESNSLNAPQGLQFPSKKNPDAEGEKETLSAAFSPDFQWVAYLQKPVWPHTIYLAKVEEGKGKPLFTPELPAHTSIGNELVWLDDDNLPYSTSSFDTGPESTSEAVQLYKISIKTGKSELMTSASRSFEQGQEPGFPLEFIPVH